jgi:hypothetical protein
MAKKPRKDRKPPLEPIYDVENLASASECTGIAPAPVQNDAEADATAALYAIHRPQPDDHSQGL